MKEKRRDVHRKLGINWDKARKIFFHKQQGPFKDKGLEFIINGLKFQNYNIDEYMTALLTKLDFITIVVDQIHEN